MRFTLRLLGQEVLHFSTDDWIGDAPDEACSLDGGTTYSQPISLTWTRGDGIDHEPESPYEE